MSFAVVVSDIAPLYTKPEPLCELADEALYGMVVEVLAREGMYCRVRTHYRYEGWTPARCLLEDGAPAAQWQSVPKLVVQKPYIDVLNEPKVQGGCLQSMPRGAFLCPEGGPDENQWQPVRLADGRLGYTKATYLAQPAPAWESVGEDELRQRLCGAALSYLGAQYRWGGKTPLGIDCSGLVSMAYLLNGVIITGTLPSSRGLRCMKFHLKQQSRAICCFSPATWRCIWERDGLFTPPDIQVQKASSSAVLRKRRRITGRI